MIRHVFTVERIAALQLFIASYTATAPDTCAYLNTFSDIIVAVTTMMAGIATYTPTLMPDETLPTTLEGALQAALEAYY